METNSGTWKTSRVKLCLTQVHKHTLPELFQAKPDKLSFALPPPSPYLVHKVDYKKSCYAKVFLISFRYYHMENKPLPRYLDPIEITRNPVLGLRKKQAEQFKIRNSDTDILFTAFPLQQIKEKVKKIQSQKNVNPSETKNLENLYKDKKSILENFERHFLVDMDSCAKARFLCFASVNLSDISNDNEKKISAGFLESVITQLYGLRKSVGQEDMGLMEKEVFNIMTTLSYQKFHLKGNALDEKNSIAYLDMLGKRNHLLNNIYLNISNIITKKNRRNAQNDDINWELLLTRYYNNYIFTENRLREFWDKAKEEIKKKLLSASKRGILLNPAEEIETVLESTDFFLFNPSDNAEASQDGQFFMTAENLVAVKWPTLINYDLFRHCMIHEIMHALSGNTMIIESGYNREQEIKSKRIGLHFFTAIEKKLGEWLNEGYTEHLTVEIDGTDYLIYIEHRKGVAKLFKLGLKEKMIKRAYNEKYDPRNPKGAPYRDELFRQVKRKLATSIKNFLMTPETLPNNKLEMILRKIGKTLKKPGVNQKG